MGPQKHWLMAATALVWILSSPQARANPDGKVLFFCNEELMTGAGTCFDLLTAVNEELAGLDLVAEARGDIQLDSSPEASIPSQVQQAMDKEDASCALWLDMTDGLLTMRTLTPGSVQPVADIELTEDEQGNLDLGDAAFRVRALIAAALFLDLPGIEEPPSLDSEPEPPPPEPPSEPIEEEPVTTTDMEDENEPALSVHLQKTLRTHWVRIDAGYDLHGFPTEGHWYHGVGLSVGVLVIPRLELFVDAAISAPNTMNVGQLTTGEKVVIVNAQYLVGLGLGYTFPLGGRVTLTPRIGFHLGVSASTVKAQDTRSHRKLNTAIFGGFELRVKLTRWLALLVSFDLENLFNFEYFEIIEGVDRDLVFRLAQLRMGLVAGVTVSF